MDELLFDTLNRYYKTLTVTGYKDYSVVYKILVLQHMQEVVNNPEYKDCLTYDDMKTMQSLLNQLIGSTCEISFPKCSCFGEEQLNLLISPLCCGTKPC